MTDLDTHFLNLVQEYRALICKVCRLYARNDEDQKDLHQEILVQVWRALPGFRREAAAGTWLYRVALNTAISFYRKQRTRAKILAEDPDAPDTWHAACPTPSDDLMTRERLDRLYAAIARLSAQTPGRLARAGWAAAPAGSGRGWTGTSRCPLTVARGHRRLRPSTGRPG